MGRQWRIRVPFARLNVVMGWQAAAQAEYERVFKTSRKPVHNTLVFHWPGYRALYLWAYAELAQDRRLLILISEISFATPREGIVLLKRRAYPNSSLQTDKKELYEANLIVATVHNAAAICMSIEKCSAVYTKRECSESLEHVEMRPCLWPCFACATHTLSLATALLRSGTVMMTLSDLG